MAGLSDLEFCVLGIVWKKGPCTAYTVRKEFVTSPSSHWSGSAGSIYPLMRRLDEKGLLRSSAGRKGRRPHLAYRITRTGLATLRRWLSPPLPGGSAAITFSPLRTRMHFLKALTPRKRIAFLEDALAGLGREIGVVEEICDRYLEEGDLFSHLASIHGLLALRSQVEWIGIVRKRLAEIDP